MQLGQSCTFFGHFIPLLVVVQFSFKLTLSCGSRNALGKRGPNKPLMLKECVPDVFEQSQQASGPANGKITRNSPEFAKIKANYNSDIVFLDDERTGADRLMSTVRLVSFVYLLVSRHSSLLTPSMELLVWFVYGT